MKSARVMAYVVGGIALLGVAAWSVNLWSGGYTRRAQVMEGLHLSSSVRLALEDIYRSTGQYPQSNAEAGIKDPPTYRDRYVSQISVLPAGQIRIEYGGELGDETLSGYALLLEPSEAAEGGEIVWKCRTSSIPRSDMPTSCLHPN